MSENIEMSAHRRDWTCIGRIEDHSTLETLDENGRRTVFAFRICVYNMMIPLRIVVMLRQQTPGLLVLSCRFGIARWNGMKQAPKKEPIDIGLDRSQVLYQEILQLFHDTRTGDIWVALRLGVSKQESRGVDPF